MSQLLEKLYSGEDLDRHAMSDAVATIIKGEMSEIEMTALLVALKLKGETSSEIAGAAAALRKAALAFPRPSGSIVDTCGTGGDGMGTINISTMVGLVAAECGVKVAKHGNRSVSSQSGSSDILQAFGLKADPKPDVALQCLEQHNFCFLFAPMYHAGVRHVMPVRTSLKTRTLFNLIGPLSNPALPNIQLLGVYNENLLVPMAEALSDIGCEKALVVNGGGLDEIALHTETQAAYLNNGVVKSMTISPEDAGLPRADISTLQIANPADIAAALLKVLQGNGRLEHINAIAMNTAAVLWLSDLVSDLKSGAELAIETMNSGRVFQRLQAIAELSHG